MSNQALTVQPAQEEYLHKILNGDLSQLTPDEQLAYYTNRCERLGLDPMSQPFLFLKTKAREGEEPKTILYATRSASDQIAKREGLSGAITSKDVSGVTAIVCVRITDGKRTIENIGAASFKYDNQAGDALKRATTQAYRRGIIQFAGLGMVSEEDIEDIHGAQKVGMLDVDLDALPKRQIAQATTVTEQVAPTNDDDDPITVEAAAKIEKVEKTLHGLTGEVEHVELTTMGEARARQKDIVARIAKARAAQASAPNLAMAGVP